MAKNYGTRSLLALATLVAVLLIPLTATHADDVGSYIIYAEGRLLCREIERDSETYGAALSWAAGYMSAINYFQPDVYNLAAGTNWTAWLRTYCAHNPSKRFDDAVVALVKVLWPTRQVTAPPTVIPPAPQPEARGVPVRTPRRSPQY
jgi:hypothetical protein